jgi:hypothetical protein
MYYLHILMLQSVDLNHGYFRNMSDLLLDLQFSHEFCERAVSPWVARIQVAY